MKRWLLLPLIVLGLTCLSRPLPAAELADVQQLIQLAPSRNMGSPYREAEDRYVAERFKATGFESGEIAFPTAAFIPGKAELRLSNGKRFALYGMAPNTVHPGNLPGGKWSGSLVDLGAGTADEVAGAAVVDAAVLMDMNSHRRWLSAVELGAKVLIFVGSERENGREGAMKLTAAPFAMPRYYLTHADGLALRRELAQSQRATVTLTQTQNGRWQAITARTQWVVIPGGKQADKVVHVQAYKDTASFVPELAPGADSAANLALLLRLVDYYKAHPPQCTLVFSAVSDHCNSLRGEQFYAGHVFPEEQAYQEELEQRDRDLKYARFYAKIYADTSLEQIARLRDEASSESGLRLMYKTPLMQELNYRRNKNRYEEYQLTTQAKRAEANEAEKRRIAARLEELKAERDDLVAMLNVCQKYGKTIYFKDIAPAKQQKFIGLMNEMATRFRQKVDDGEAELAEMAANGRLAELLKGKKTYLYFTLDLTFANDKMGFFFQGGDIRFSLSAVEAAVGPMADLSVQVARSVPGAAEHFIDTIRKDKGIDWRHHLADKFALAASIGGGVVVPSLTLTTAGDTRDTHFTPSDTLDVMGPARVAAMLDFAERFLPALMEHEEFTVRTRAFRARNYQCVTMRYNTRLMDPFTVEIPQDPAKETLVIAGPSRLFTDLPQIVGAVAEYQLAITNRQGVAMFRAIPPILTMEAYRFDPAYGAIDATLDASAGARRIKPVPDPVGNRWSWVDQIALVFTGVQTDLVGLAGVADLASGLPLEDITLLDAIRESCPDHFGIAGIRELRTKGRFVPRLGHDGVACLFTEPNMPVKIITDRFLLLNASTAKPDGIGFEPGDASLRTMHYTAARDLQAINGNRIQRIRSKGVTNGAAQELFDHAGVLIGEAESSRTVGGELAFLSKASEALYSSFRSYVLVRQTTSDLIKAVAAFLALVIPFCLFLMKLLTPWTDIRAQIGSFLTIFAVMAMGLALLHPAFSLSQTPMIVLLAFVMIGLAVFVMFILHGRFDSGLKHLVEESQGVSSAEGTRSTLAGVAFSVGVNNMRRRRIRTTLTSATIVLVTFTMLSVISVGQSNSPYRRWTQKETPYNGVLFAKPGMSPITETEADEVVARLVRPGAVVVKRTWTQRLDAYGGYMPLILSDPQNPPQALQAKSLMGVDRAENGFLGQLPLVAGRWFSSNAAEEVLLSAEAAQTLGITRENFRPRALMLLGQKVQLVGLLDDAKLAAMRDLANVPFLPLESQADPVTKTHNETGAATVSAQDATAGPAPNPRGLQPCDCALVPIDFALSLPGTSVRSVALRAPTPAAAWDSALHFHTSTGTLTYTGLADDVQIDDTTKVKAGQYSLAIPVGAGVGGASKVAIPICLAATIILNTMLGSVMERKKEISIYNSIGLNPTHVFVFFVAEALVFGLIGSVAGYLIGQALALAITKFQLLPGINLNYSSMAVMVVIFASMLTVIFSTLYPAYVATRAAVPSGQRRWKLPPPQGDELSLDFPFSYNEHQLLGVCAFLHQFMDLNSEASSGQFLAQDARFGHVKDAEGRRVLVMVYKITPVPFDLGVNQRMEIYGYYRPKVRAYVMAVYLTRLKGDKTSWLVVNQPFMESLRARLLSWRSQTPANQEQFCKQGEALFADAAEFSVKETEA